MELVIIFLEVLLPILILIGIGAILHKKFHFDLNTLAKINIYFLIPGLILTRLYETDLEWSLFRDVFLFFLLFSLTLYFVSNIISKIFNFNRGMRIAFSNSTMFFNSGNYGVPVNDLVFRQDPFAMAIQVLILTFQNILVYSYGIIVLQANRVNFLKAMIPYFRMPLTYAMLAGILLNVFDWELPPSIYTPSAYIADALVAIALLTLGAQVVQLKISKNLWNVFLSVGVRLLFAPFAAYFIIQLINVGDVMGQALFIASAVPSSVNSAIIAQEYENEPDFAAQAVLFSTILSVITVTLVIFTSRMLF